MVLVRIHWFLLLLYFTFNYQSTFDLKVQVMGGKADKGSSIISLFDSSDNFLKTPLRMERLPFGSSGQVEYVFKTIPTGTYAISVTYDEDNNGELNTNFFGIPTELIGFSNDARSSFGPPSFEKAAFDLSAHKTVIIKLGKAKD